MAGKCAAHRPAVPILWFLFSEAASFTTTELKNGCVMGVDRFSEAYGGPGCMCLGAGGEVSPSRPASRYSVPFAAECCKALVDKLGIAFFFLICLLFFGILQLQSLLVSVAHSIPQKKKDYSSLSWSLSVVL